MIPTRPIKTFARWFEHEVSVTAPKKQWDRIGLLLSERGLKLAQGVRPAELDNYDYFQTITWSGDDIIFFHFDNIEDANFLCKKLKGKFAIAYRKSDGVRRNHPIFDNFTMADLTAIFGDPLPAKIQFLLKDLKSRNIDYFSAYQHMHQKWSKQKWWPEAFVFINRPARKDEGDLQTECLRWLHNQGIIDLVNRHACGMYEFANANDAMLFKLTFGEDVVPKRK